ncbi:isoprenylcysteine carboxylmethyltransferase family protein [Nocardioides sp. IC4_145]|uniref:methyltransferase family protein n=1 Tax=Nocardioides sp. IC4_145 TaxID=2714037 RepID=UPI00140E243D|nr:isoprenylcysteine carboxylmethyltransferase family protein [Nocardioides sp. IC4_145]NHC22934.1 isoprenylcysteine carboxylmethyltransferase family protein [Nocardioides sp. IC4_145]
MSEQVFWPTVAALIYALYLATAFVGRTLLQRRATGDGGFRGISGRVGSAEWLAGVGFIVAMVAGVAGPMAALGGLDPIAVLEHRTVFVAGAVVAALGVVATLVVQGHMGESWRIGVDESERTALVTTGAFAIVRNPIFTAMAFTGAGLTAMTPNLVSLTGFALLLVALQLQVRVVEEPYLFSVHCAHEGSYAGYAARVGRFIPGVGRIRPGADASAGPPEAAATN